MNQEPDIYEYLEQLAEDVEEDLHEEAATEYDEDMEDILRQLKEML